jgi:hypothetical protein
VTERPTYFWSYALSIGLTISGGALAVVSVLAYFMPGTLIPADTAKTLCVVAFACMVGFSVACANCTAGAAQHAISASKFYPWTFWPALICTLGFCVTTGIGVHLGWSLMTQGIASHELPDARIVTGAAVFIALAKPAMNWIIEGRRGIDRDAADAEQAVENARIEAIRQRDREARPDNVTQLRPKTRRSIVGAAAAASAMLLGGPQDAADAAPQTQLDAPHTDASDAPETHQETQAAAPASLPQTQPKTQRRGASKRKPTDYETRVSEAKRLLTTQPDVSNREIARRAGVSPSKVDRLVREMTPLRNAAA